MSSVEAGILAGSFVGCLVVTLVIAAILFGMFPSLACPTCKKEPRNNLTAGTYDEDGLCCIACEWCCMRYCGCCQPKRLRKRLLEEISERAKAEREAEEAEAEAKAKQEKEEAEAKAKAKQEKEKQEAEAKAAAKK